MSEWKTYKLGEIFKTRNGKEDDKHLENDQQGRILTSRRDGNPMGLPFATTHGSDAT